MIGIKTKQIHLQDPIPACGGVLYTDGTIETPDFPAHYPSSAKCRWIINAEQNKKIAINFESFQTEPGRDFLTVRSYIHDQYPCVSICQEAFNIFRSWILFPICHC